jgi:hypothetical protein
MQRGMTHHLAERAVRATTRLPHLLMVHRTRANNHPPCQKWRCHSLLALLLIEIKLTVAVLLVPPPHPPRRVVSLRPRHRWRRRGCTDSAPNSLTAVSLSSSHVVFG